MNGEGKTTMVKLLLGLFEPDSGRILIGGKPLQAYARESAGKNIRNGFSGLYKVQYLVKGKRGNR